MTAQFPDHASLAFAYDELLRVGVPEQRMTPYFEKRTRQDSDPSEHEAFLRRLHGWALSSSQKNLEVAATIPADEAFSTRGGTLTILCPQREEQIIEIVLRFEGHLVG